MSYARPSRRIALLAAGAVLASGFANVAPASATRFLTSDDVALGGQELATPVPIGATGKFTPLLRIRSVKFTKGEAPRALLLGALSLKNDAAAGDVLVRVRMLVNGVPDEHVWFQTVAAGAWATVSILCNRQPVPDQTENYALQVAVTGAGPVIVETGTFDVVAFRPIFNPP